MGKIEIDTGDYSINDIKSFFRFRVGDIIETTSNHPMGTYMTLKYVILSFEKNGANCRLLSISGNYRGENIHSTFYNTIHSSFINGKQLRRFFKKTTNE